MAATCRHGHGLLGSLGSREKGGSEPQTSPCRLGPVRTAEVWDSWTDGAGRASLAVSPMPAQGMPRTAPWPQPTSLQAHRANPLCRRLFTLPGDRRLSTSLHRPLVPPSKFWGLAGSSPVPSAAR